ILEKTCGDRSYGARPLRRALQKYIEDPLSEALIHGSLPRPAELEVYLGDTALYHRQVNVEDEVAVTARGPVDRPSGTLLYPFESGLMPAVSPRSAPLRPLDPVPDFPRAHILRIDRLVSRTIAAEPSLRVAAEGSHVPADAFVRIE